MSVPNKTTLTPETATFTSNKKSQNPETSKSIINKYSLDHDMGIDSINISNPSQTSEFIHKSHNIKSSSKPNSFITSVTGLSHDLQKRILN